MALTRSQLMRIKENRRYWRDREAKQREAYIRTDNEELAEINRVYSDMYRWAEREINAFYGKYADAEGIDITEAKRKVSQLDIAEYEKLAKEYVKDRDFSAKANQEMRLYNATMKINRLELLKAQIGLKLVDGINDIDKHWEKIATDRATQEIIRQSGILGKTLTETETAKTAKQIVNADFYNATFSERIWSHMDNLRSDIAIELQKGFIAGVSSREMARRLKEHAFDKSEKDAFRLARTELRRVQTDVAKDNYERNGIEQYEYMAVNPSACPICRELDGRVFDVAKMKAGLNAPPIHPNCHCTTAPHIDDDEYEQWLTWLEKGGTSAQWDEMSPAERHNWYDKIVQSTPKIATPQPQTPPQPMSQAHDRLVEYANVNGVGYHRVGRLKEELSEERIIRRIAGGDMTTGSCVSLALTYIGNKFGLDVLDFRGGSSCRMFALNANNRKLCKLNGVGFMENKDFSSVKGATRLINDMEDNRQYMLVTGRHASIVRKLNGIPQYLELQSATNSGWNNFKTDQRTMSDTLRRRFGCTKSRTLYGTKLEQHSYAIDIETLYNSDELEDLLGYINTKEDKQKKGALGSVK